ncbi:MAG: neutral zinc metallopeptidase [Ancrocorticia sp.]
MSMNDGIRLDGSRVQRRGRGTVAAGGIGGVGLIGAIIIYFLAGQVVDPQALTPPSFTSEDGGDLSAQCQTGSDANASTECWMVATAESLDAYWQAQLPAETDIEYVQPQFVVFDDSTTTACGTGSAQMGPFYCPADQTVYLDVTFFDQLETDFGTENSTLAQSYIVAHEFGHHIQNQLGYLQRVRQGDSGPSGSQVRSELQADCLAGAWLNNASTTVDPESGETFLQPITREQLDSAVSAAAAVGDDHIMESAGVTVNQERFTHGSAEQRMNWLVQGYNNGTVASCNTWDVAQP